MIYAVPIYIFNRQALEERFGGWPAFHDAEVQAIRLDSGQRRDEPPSVELDIHVFDTDGVLPSGKLNFVRHTLVTLRCEEADEIVLDDFGYQNVLFDLLFEDLGSAAPGNARMLVRLSSSFGVGGHVRCEQCVVLGVEDFKPGPRSAYNEGR